MITSRKVIRVNLAGREVKSLVERVKQDRPPLWKSILYPVVLAMALLVLSGAADAKYPGHMVTETYVVQSGDNLWSIAGRYLEKNTYGSRDIREFKEGIIELNFDRVFSGRTDQDIYPGDELKINYWVKD